MISVFPALFAFLAVAVMMFYKLDNKQMAQIEMELTERRATQQAAQRPQQEKGL